MRSRIAFYGCTVAYKPVLDIHGWGELQTDLIALNRQHRTDEMSQLITDEMVKTIAVVGDPESVIDQMIARFDGNIARSGFTAEGIEPDRMKELIGRLRESDNPSA